MMILINTLMIILATVHTKISKEIKSKSIGQEGLEIIQGLAKFVIPEDIIESCLINNPQISNNIK